MCDTCPTHIPGPGEVADGLLGLAVGAAISKPGRKILFWGLAVPWVLGIVVYTAGWWLLPIGLGVLALGAGVLLVVRRILHGHTVITRPELTPQMRAALAARGLKPIPAPGRQAQPALPRAVRRQLPGWRLTATVVRARQSRPAQAIPAAKAIEPTRVLPAAVNRPRVP